MNSKFSMVKRVAVTAAAVAGLSGIAYAAGNNESRAQDDSDSVAVPVASMAQPASAMVLVQFRERLARLFQTAAPLNPVF